MVIIFLRDIMKKLPKDTSKIISYIMNKMNNNPDLIIKT